MSDEVRVRREISGRKFATISVISTFCIVQLASVILTISGKMSIEVYLASTGSLGTITLYIVKAYFDDKDRKLENGGEK